MRNTRENRDAYWKDAKDFVVKYGAAVLVSGFIFRWAMHETVELFQNAMFVVAGLVFLVSGFAGAHACEIYFTLKGFEGNWYDPADSFPKWYGTAKALSSVGMVALTGGYFVLLAML